jgi:hypothetical protein
MDVAMREDDTDVLLDVLFKDTASEVWELPKNVVASLATRDLGGQWHSNPILPL